MFLNKDFNSFLEKKIFDNFNESIIEAVICAERYLIIFSNFFKSVIII